MPQPRHLFCRTLYPLVTQWVIFPSTVLVGKLHSIPKWSNISNSYNQVRTEIYPIFKKRLYLCLLSPSAATRTLFSEGAYHIPQQERETEGEERMEERDSVSAREASLRIMWDGDKNVFFQSCTLVENLLNFEEWGLWPRFRRVSLQGVCMWGLCKKWREVLPHISCCLPSLCFWFGIPLMYTL